MNTDAQSYSEQSLLDLLKAENQSTSVIKFAGPSIIEAMQEEHAEDESSDTTD